MTADNTTQNSSPTPAADSPNAPYGQITPAHHTAKEPAVDELDRWDHTATLTWTIVGSCFEPSLNSS